MKDEELISTPCVFRSRLVSPVFPFILPPSALILALQPSSFRLHPCPSWSSHREILESGFPHQNRIVQVAPVEHDRRLEASLHVVEIRAAKLLPFGDDDQRIRPIERGRGGRGEVHCRFFREDQLRLLQRDRIIDVY